MDDLISRQALLDKAYVMDLSDTGNYVQVHVVDVDDIMRLPSEPRWIPVSERLPEEDGLYLVTTSKGQTQVHVFNHNGNSEEYWMRCNKAWMSLPEPYKEEKMNDDTIYRQAAIEALKRAEALTRAFGYHNVIETIRELPAAEPRKGRWLRHEDEDGEHYGDECSECGEWYVMPYGKTNFCPNCGARMEESE